MVPGAHSGAVPEAHDGAIFAGVGASGRTQPQREVPALEAALFQLHAGLQGRTPAAQAPGSQPQHSVEGGRRGARTGGWGPAGRGRERCDGGIKGQEVLREMQSPHTLRMRKPTQREDLLTTNCPRSPSCWASTIRC